MIVIVYCEEFGFSGIFDKEDAQVKFLILGIHKGVLCVGVRILSLIDQRCFSDYPKLFQDPNRTF